MLLSHAFMAPNRCGSSTCSVVPLRPWLSLIFWDPDEAVKFACQSSAAQVQGQSPNGGFASCFCADAGAGCGHLPGRMVAAAGPAMVLQSPMRFLFGNVIEGGRHMAGRAVELLACRFSHLVPDKFLPGAAVSWPQMVVSPKHATKNAPLNPHQFNYKKYFAKVE